MVARLFREEARQAARDNLLFNKYTKLLQEHKLQPLSEPKVDHLHDKDGKLAATLIVEVLQPVTLGQYLGLEVETMPPRSTEESLKKTVAEIKQSYPRLTDVTDGAVEVGNVIVADFTVSDGDKQCEKQENFKLSIGKNLYYQPFEQQLVGLKLGENKEFDINFPSDYHKEDFRNKAMHFNLTVKEIKSVSEYTDDELAKVLGYESEEKMAELLVQEIDAKYKSDEHLFYENQILGQLLAAHQFKIPRRLIDREIGTIRVEHPEMPPERVEEIADRFIRTDLVLHAVYERHPEIQFTQDEFNAQIAELAAKANDTVEGTIQKLQTAGKLQRYVDYLTNCKVINFLIDMADKKEAAKVETTEQATVTEEKDNG
jgi:trigger factor